MVAREREAVQLRRQLESMKAATETNASSLGDYADVRDQVGEMVQKEKALASESSRLLFQSLRKVLGANGIDIISSTSMSRRTSCRVWRRS